MAILSKSDYFDKLDAVFKGKTDEESIGMMEDFIDTYNDLETRADGDGENWKQKYEELDKEWKQKYKNRFFNTGGGNPSLGDNKSDDKDGCYTPESVNFDNLFN